jgi:hypothetical protein
MGTQKFGLGTSSCSPCPRSRPLDRTPHALGSPEREFRVWSFFAAHLGPCRSSHRRLIRPRRMPAVRCGAQDGEEAEARCGVGWVGDRHFFVCLLQFSLFCLFDEISCSVCWLLFWVRGSLDRHSCTTALRCENFTRFALIGDAALTEAPFVHDPTALFLRLFRLLINRASALMATDRRLPRLSPTLPAASPTFPLPSPPFWPAMPSPSLPGCAGLRREFGGGRRAVSHASSRCREGLEQHALCKEPAPQSRPLPIRPMFPLPLFFSCPAPIHRQ